LSELGEGWDDDNRFGIRTCWEYLVALPDTDSAFLTLRGRFGGAGGAQKTAIAAVLAEKGVEEATKYIFERLRNGDKVERGWIRECLYKTRNDDFIPYLERFLRSPPESMTAEELEKLGRTLESLKDERAVQERRK
jgi:hypothetical protein